MPRYKDLRAILQAEIAAGLYPVGAKFPTEYALCDRFAVSRYTVREALRGLQDQGLIARQAGSGATVLKASAAAPVGGLRFENRHEGVVVFRETLAALLGRTVGERWLRFAGLSWDGAATRPQCWTETFVAGPYFAVRGMDDADETAVRARIETQFGLKTKGIEQRISAVMLPPDIAAALDADPARPALLERRSYFAEDVAESGAAPFQISFGLHPGDRYAYTQHLAAAR